MVLCLEQPLNRLNMQLVWLLLITCLGEQLELVSSLVIAREPQQLCQQKLQSCQFIVLCVVSSVQRTSSATQKLSSVNSNQQNQTTSPPSSSSSEPRVKTSQCSQCTLSSACTSTNQQVPSRPLSICWVKILLPSLRRRTQRT